MPPKLKKKKGGKKKKKDDGPLSTDDKYKKTLEEIETLKDHLALRKEITRRAQTVATDLKDKVVVVEDNLREHDLNHRAVSADMTRQYKTMQTEMALRIHHLTSDLQKTRVQLELTEAALKQSKEEKEKMEMLKNQEIADLNVRITTMGTKYEIILNEAMNDLEDKITLAKNSWTHDALQIQSANKKTLLDFGLNPLEL